jgi:hypothetical protein
MRTQFSVQRISDRDAIEARLLDLAHRTDVKLTAPALAYYAPCTIEDASRVLDELASRDVLAMEIQDDGSIVYELRGRQKIAELAPPRAVAPVALQPISRTGIDRVNPIIAGLLSLWIPGAGHVYAGRIAAAILWFLVVGLGYVLILPGLVLHLFSIVSAANAARLANSPVVVHQLAPPPPAAG